MAELTPLDEKLAEVLGLARAAEKTTEYVSTMDGADEFEDDLEQMKRDASETARRTDELIDELEGKKSAIRDKAQETKSEAEKMRQTYLGNETDALEGFEFLTMAEAAELGHWEIVRQMASTVGDGQTTDLADWAIDIQREHFEGVREASLVLAEHEVSASG